jgi:hypothetical protein
MEYEHLHNKSEVLEIIKWNIKDVSQIYGTNKKRKIVIWNIICNTFSLIAQ